ncbi:MAG: response regulator transcription factor [Cyclobacteriaceae bacterium]
MKTSDKRSILLVEDDDNLGFVIKDNLEIGGYEVKLCENGELAWEAFCKGKFDLCILDVMLPKMDGFTLAERIRSNNDQVPVLFLTAKSMKEDKIHGFKIGADDYITKPFSIEELLLRIEVFLRRTNRNDLDHESHFEIGKYAFDFTNLKLTINGSEKGLTKREAELLKLLCLNQQSVVKRGDILNRIWGDDDYFNGRSLDVFISKLRKYLRDDPSIEIANYHGVGFKLEMRA